MNFIQFLFPHGTRKTVEIDVPAEIEEKVSRIVAEGFEFQIECHPDTGKVLMDCCNAEAPLASRLCENGPQVSVMVNELVNEAFERLPQVVKELD